MKKLIIALFMLLSMSSVKAEGLAGDSLSVTLRFGYHLGGTSPVGLPSSIRSMNNYTLMPNFQWGGDIERRLSPLMGIAVGLRFENKGMQVDARVKNYHIAIVQGSQHHM